MDAVCRLFLRHQLFRAAHVRLQGLRDQHAAVLLIIVITHKRGTMEEADVLYGVTMQEEGVSKVLRLSVEEAQLVLDREQNGRNN